MLFIRGSFFDLDDGDVPLKFRTACNGLPDVMP
jgi:hypothetical protein